MLSAGVASLGSVWVAQAKDHTELHAEQASSGYERAVLEIVEFIKSGNLSAAQTRVDKHLQQFPKSRVGHLLKADILQAMAAPLQKVGAKAETIKMVHDDPELPPPSEVVKGLKHQLQNRWSHAREADQQAHALVPASLIDLGQHPHVLVADMQQGRLYLYKNEDGAPQLIRDYYLSVGSAGFGKQVEGDNKTPVGVYSIYRYIDDSELPDLYGEGAFPVNYPNRLDRYRKRTGYGIWLHGTPSNTYARSPWASEGCFVLSNDDFLDIENYIDVKRRTPVILSDQIEWVSPQQLAQRRADYLAVLSQWKQDWESLSTDAYLAHYSENNFNLGRTDYRQWAKRKREVNNRKTFVQVDMDIKHLFTYPGEQDMFVVKYQQRYLSNNYQGVAEKEQYWQRDANSGRWQIIYEG
ncbi:MAG: L,D-transpeptidase family protein [Gammaproteobacteria bacterium]|nr:L,D-transpeptidase family protein [Gammaproteobacteria bacterium]